MHVRGFIGLCICKIQSAAVILILTAVPNISFADNRDWARKGLQASDEKYKYFVGISAPHGNKQDAIEQAKNNATILLVNQEFSSKSQVTVKTSEDVSAISVEKSTLVKIENIDLSHFEMVDQEIEKIEGNIPLYVAHVLFRFDKSKIEEQRQRIADKSGASGLEKQSEQDEINWKLKAAVQDKKQRDIELKKIDDTWREIFPLLGLDAAVGLAGVKNADFLTLNFGLRLRLIDRIYIGAFYTYGGGSSRKPTPNNSGDKSNSSASNSLSHSSYMATNSGAAENGDQGSTSSEHADQDVMIKMGLDTRIYLIRDIQSGFYLKGLWAEDQVHVTCSKDPNGKCTSPMPKNQSGYGYAGGLGFQMNKGVFYYWIEGVAGKNSNPEIAFNGNVTIGMTWGMIK